MWGSTIARVWARFVAWQTVYRICAHENSMKTVDQKAMQLQKIQSVTILCNLCLLNWNANASTGFCKFI